MGISKVQALGIVFRSADTYMQELENRNLLFICVDKHGRTSAFETAFHDYNYQHLTGLETAQTLSAQLFIGHAWIDVCPLMTLNSIQMEPVR